MKKTLNYLFLIVILFLIYFYRNDIISYIMRNIIDKPTELAEKNEYYKDIDYGFVQNTNSMYAKNKQDILNIIYTSLNRGLTESEFYCDYKECTDDVNSIAEDSDTLASINNFVHPYNSYSKIYFTITNYGKIRIRIDHIYSDSSILLVNNEIDRVMRDNINNANDKIKAFHDYIVNNTIYDNTVSLVSQKYVQTNSSNAMGLLFEKKAICSGYSDAMAIFLNKVGINNYKISSDTHIWNLVYLDGEWKHIDATWDDPVTNDGSNVLLSDFYLISTDTLEQKEKDLNKNDHLFNKDIYKEA